MPNIGTVVREEIVRLSRKECRQQVEPIKKTTTQMRHEVAALKRRVAQLERHVMMLSRQVAMLSRKVIGTASVKVAVNAKPSRFSAKGLQAQRLRLELSAADFGKLLGVSAKSIYNWEAEKARPRAEQIAKLGALRGLGKREVADRLEQL